MPCRKTLKKCKKIVKIAVKLPANSQMPCLIVKGTPLKRELFCRKWRKIHAPKKVLALKKPTYLPPHSKLSYCCEEVPLQQSIIRQHPGIAKLFAN